MHNRLIEPDLNRLRDTLLVMGGAAERAIALSIRALVNRDSELAEQVIREDDAIDRMEVEIDGLCVDLLALKQPAASDLRFVVSTARVAPVVERIADHAVNVAKHALSLNEQPALELYIDLPRMAAVVQDMLVEGLYAITAGAPEKARENIERDDEVDLFYDRSYVELIRAMTARPSLIEQGVQWAFVLKHLERIADYVTNICEDIVDSIRYNLEREGFRARIADTGESALDLILGRPPDLILLDLNLPRMSGFELCSRLRSEAATSRVPILMLTARGQESDKVLGLNLGADDYITKPFSMRELMARINAVLRRARRPDADRPVYDDGTLVINPSTFSVRCRGRDVRLTRKEFALLEELARNAGRVLTRESLLDRVWGHNYYGDSRTLDVHIRRLRQKLDSPELIETVTGIGYRLQRPGASGEA